MMAMAGKITVAEVEELVPEGSLDPNAIHTPGIFVQRIFQGSGYEKRIEQRTVSITINDSNQHSMLDKNGIAQRIAQEVRNGWYVNLGIGIPTLVANYIPSGMEVGISIGERHLGDGSFSDGGR